MLRGYKFVVIESPYDHYEDCPSVRSFMGRLFQLKLAGYKSHYSYGIMPVSNVDFFANHIAFCRVTLDGLIPLGAFKSISVSRCTSVGIEFPLYEHVLGDKTSARQKQAAKAWVNGKTQEQQEVAYNASWTMCPSLMHDDEQRKIVRDASVAMLHLYYKSYPIDWVIAAASKKYKVHQLKENLGFNYLVDENGVVPDFEISAFDDEPFYMMTLDTNVAQPPAIDRYSEYAALWEQRMAIESVHLNEDSFTRLASAEVKETESV